MNVFDKAIAQLGLHRESPAQWQSIYSLFRAMSAGYNGEDVHANPPDEILRRLAVVGIHYADMERITVELNDWRSKIVRGQA